MLDGWPNVTATFDFTLDPSGAIALQFAGQLDADGVDEFTVGGTACGAEVEESVTID